MGMRYQREGGDNIVFGGVTFVLPVFSKGQELTATGTARGARLRAELDAARTRVRIELQTALAAYERRAAAARVLETEALPGLDDTDALTTRSFDVGQIGLPDVLRDSPRAARHAIPTSVRPARGRAGARPGGRCRGSTAMTMIRLEPVAWSLGPSCCSASPAVWRSLPAAAVQPPAPQAQADGRAAVTTPAQHADAGEVRIEAGMLRDLRITTAQVESRQGGEQVTLLGELAVDERSYAEVGAPVAARVVRLMAGDRRPGHGRAGAAGAAIQRRRPCESRLPFRCRSADPGREQPEAKTRSGGRTDRAAEGSAGGRGDGRGGAGRAAGIGGGAAGHGADDPTEDGSDTDGSPTFQLHARSRAR